MAKDKIGQRFKENYEHRTRQFLTRRTNTIIRIDGKNFSNYTKDLKRPFDEGLIEDMQLTTKYLCENIQGCKLGYTQSDEITLVLTDYDKLETHAWFDGNVQKITSISAAMATAKFNELRLLRECKDRLINREGVKSVIYTEMVQQSKLPVFDSRVFQIPEQEEVVNCLVWRQQDAVRNSIQMLAQSLYSHKELYGKNTSDLQEMCFQKGHNWNDLSSDKKIGSLIIKNTYANGKLLTQPDNPEVGDLWWQPDVESCFHPSKQGRLLEWGPVEGVFMGANDEPITVDDWVDIEIKTVRTKWDIIDTPTFTKDRDIILNQLPKV